MRGLATRRVLIALLHAANGHHAIQRLQVQTTRVLRLQKRALLHAQRTQPREHLSRRQTRGQRERQGESLGGRGE